MASLCFCALDLVDYARWFPIHIRHENTLTGIQRIGQHCWYGRCLSRTINFNVCDGTKITIVMMWSSLACCIRGVVSRHEGISENIDFNICSTIRIIVIQLVYNGICV